MNRRISSTAATAALIACCVCHVWTLLQLLRDVVDREQAQSGVGPGLPCILLYLGAVCLFNWFALTSGSRAYRRGALLATGLHLMAALLQGAAAEAILLAGQESRGWVMNLGVILPSAVNLPLDSTRVIGELGSITPWLTSLFFAFNLTILLLRLRRIPE